MTILRVKKLMALMRTLFVLGLSLPATALADTGPPLAGSALDRAVSGRRIYLATPLGGEFPMNYYRDGRLDAQGEAEAEGGCEHRVLGRCIDRRVDQCIEPVVVRQVAARPCSQHLEVQRLDFVELGWGDAPRRKFARHRLEPGHDLEGVAHIVERQARRDRTAVRQPPRSSAP